MMPQMGGRIQLMLKPTARAAGLQAATGSAEVDVKSGTVDITVKLAEGSKLRQGPCRGLALYGGTQGRAREVYRVRGRPEIRLTESSSRPG